MSGKEYLQRVKMIDTQLKNKSFEIKRLKELGMNTGRVFNDMAALENERAQIIKAIEKLPEAEYDVLYKVYVKYETLKEVAADRDISYSLAATIHGTALKRLENIINI